MWRNFLPIPGYICTIGFKFMENLIAQFAQLFRASAKTLLNFPNFQGSSKSFGILFGNWYIQFVVKTRYFLFICAEGKLR